MVLERTFGEDPRLRVLGLIPTLRGEPVTVVITDQYFSRQSYDHLHEGRRSSASSQLNPRTGLNVSAFHPIPQNPESLLG